MSLKLMKPPINLDKYKVTFEDTQRVIEFEELADDYDAYIDGGHRIKGAKLIWGATHDVVSFEGGVVTLWAGYTSHGKSLLLGQACIGFAAQGEKVCIASLEMPPLDTYKRLIKQAAQNEKPSKEFNREFSAWLNDKVIAFDYVGNITPSKMLQIVQYAAGEHGVKHFVIDNLMKCVRGEDDYNGQKDFINDLQTLASLLNIHIHVVAHLRKGGGDGEIPTMDFVKGSSAMIQMVQQVLIVHRNMKKVILLEKAHATNDQVELEKIRTMPDARLIIAKNRNGNGDGAIPLWFDPKSMQYRAQQRFATLDLMEWTAK